MRILVCYKLLVQLPPGLPDLFLCPWIFVPGQSYYATSLIEELMNLNVGLQYVGIKEISGALY